MPSYPNPNCYGLSTGSRKLYFPSVGCRKHKKLGNTVLGYWQLLQLVRLLFLLTHRFRLVRFPERANLKVSKCCEAHFVSDDEAILVLNCKYNLCIATVTIAWNQSSSLFLDAMRLPFVFICPQFSNHISFVVQRS